MNQLLRYVIHVVFLIALYGTSTLVFEEYTIGNICPKILQMPACYIIMACFLIPFVVHLMGKYHTVYFIGTGLAWIIAAFGSIMNLIKIVECPKTSGETPMCYISFGIFSSLILLKILELKKST